MLFYLSTNLVKSICSFASRLILMLILGTNCFLLPLIRSFAYPLFNNLPFITRRWRKRKESTFIMQSTRQSNCQREGEKRRRVCSFFYWMFACDCIFFLPFSPNVIYLTNKSGLYGICLFYLSDSESSWSLLVLTKLNFFFSSLLRLNYL